MEEGSLRVSDADREQVVAALRDHLLAGRLTLEEFSERVGVALEARIGTELARAQHDLPDTPVPAARQQRRAARLTAAFFGYVGRRGRLRLSGLTTALSVFADI